MKVVKNTVEDVKFIVATMACSVLVVVWHYECHNLIKEIRILDNAVLGLSKTASIEKVIKLDQKRVRRLVNH